MLRTYQWRLINGAVVIGIINNMHLIATTYAIVAKVSFFAHTVCIALLPHWAFSLQHQSV